MDSIGAEVGQKMRSAIKAKLMELECYVDDELPDYIMVMVANRRTKAQMNEDLNLFLSAKTSTFVNWLHIVLKKLKEVTVTNPDVYKKAIKRKSNEQLPDDKSSLKVKKEKTHKKVKKELPVSHLEETSKETSSLTDNLPFSVNNFAANRRIIVSTDKPDDPSNENIEDDTFDIPLLSEVADSVNEQELQDIERKIRNVKSRLGLLVESDEEENSAAVKSENEQESEAKTLRRNRQINILENSVIDKSSSVEDHTLELQNKEISYTPEREVDPKPKHKRIIFENNPEPSVKSRFRSRESHERDCSRGHETFKERSLSPIASKPKRSILDRLGKRLGSPDKSLSNYRLVGGRSERRRRSTSVDRNASNRSEKLRDRSRSFSRDRSPLKTNGRTSDRSKESKKEGVLSRLGVQSKVAVVQKPAAVNLSDEEEEKVIREVQSSIKVKPRVIPTGAVQPNKNLLLKAVADAQRSVAQTPKVGKEVEAKKSFNKKSAEKNVNRKNERFRRVSPRPRRFNEIIKQSSSRMRSRLGLSSDEYDSDGEYIPQPVKQAGSDVPDYVPSSKINNKEMENKNQSPQESVTKTKQQFIITLDGVEKLEFKNKTPDDNTRDEITAKKRVPSPIIFHKSEKVAKTTTSRSDIPDRLPVVRPPLSIKNKERCKYWPSCRQGDKCEFVHPSESCQLFPQCKFGDKCLFMHPKCKFGNSCTKRDCVYDHVVSKPVLVSGSKSSSAVSTVQNCKFYPNCAKINCPFYHPKPCKYGKFCKNIGTCAFSHSVAVNRKSLSWTAK